MKLACADFTFPLLEHERALDLISFLDVEGVDLALMGNRSHIRPEIVRDDLDGWSERLRSRIADRGLELADFFVIPWTDFERMAPNNPSESERAEARLLFEDMLYLGSELGAPGMTLLPGIHWPDESWQVSFERCVEELKWRVEKAQERGVRFSVEAHIGSIVPTPEQAIQLVEAVDGLELTLDYTHFVIQGIPEKDVDLLIPHARHFHARGATATSLQTSLRANTIDYVRILDKLIDADYDGYMGIEYVWTPADPPGSAYDLTNTDNVAETIQMRDLIRGHLREQQRA